MMVTGWRKGRFIEACYCSASCLEAKHDHHAGDEYWLLLGDTPSTERVVKVDFARARLREELGL